MTANFPGQALLLPRTTPLQRKGRWTHEEVLDHVRLFLAYSDGAVMGIDYDRWARDQYETAVPSLGVVCNTLGGWRHARHLARIKGAYEGPWPQGMIPPHSVEH